MTKPLDLNQPYFTQADLCDIAGISNGTANNWIQGGQLNPSSAVRRGRGRRYPRLFTTITVFKARLLKELRDSIGLEPAESATASESAEIADVISEDSWMWAAARAIERGKPMTLFAYAARLDGRWKFEMTDRGEDAPPSFGNRSLHIYVPIAAIFGEVYAAAKTLLTPTAAAGPGGSTER